MLSVADSTPIFSVVKVRNSFEHFDERIDSRLAGGATCISDWYISDGTAAVTPPIPGSPSSAIGLRVFFPAGGTLHFEGECLDLFVLDLALLSLRVNIRESRKRLLGELEGRARFGDHVLANLLAPEQVEPRRTQWREARSAALAALGCPT